MTLSNDTRGWIMTAVSGIACVLGAAIICVDIIVCRFSGMKGFRIQDSNAFLSASLSLSFGVMLFSSTYKMLPSSKKSLLAGGLSPKAAAWVLIICFISGALGIQIVSRMLHHYIPSHVVNCEHTHDEDHDSQKEHDHDRSVSRGSKSARFSRNKSYSRSDRWPCEDPDPEAQASYFTDAPEQPYPPTREVTRTETFMTAQTDSPSIQGRLKRTLSKLSFPPADDRTCDNNGPCHGFTETCGQECFKIVGSRGNTIKSVRNGGRVGFAGTNLGLKHTESTPLLGEIRESSPVRQNSTNSLGPSISAVSDSQTEGSLTKPLAESGTLTPYDHAVRLRHKTSTGSEDTDDHPHQHHHHVPNNAFLSIGLQTSIAIALHKLPEGFITYATNHANPTLGFSVFLALFIHNITEGFALALPLFLALRSRWKAMLWAFVLGGCSQPLGAGVAALWFKIAGNTDMAPGERVYGGMFAVTAGIMTSVALQLFSESLDLTHNRNLCMMSAFVGMGIMGISSALTAE